ncbi:MAG: M16 family metallopeptidase [Gemmatimonadota bacterium]
MLKLNRLLFVLGLLLAQVAVAQGALPAGVQRGVEFEGISEYRLENGLRVLLYPDASKPTITVNVTYLVGSRMESYGETGMAHLLEHLMFKGTPKNPMIWEQYKKRGFQINGTTSFDRTNYFEVFNANDEDLHWAIETEADRMVNSFISRKDLDSEMTVVRNEYEMGENDPGNVLVKRLAAVMYDWHNYGKLPIGNRSDIENVSIENLQAFYRTYYQPDNAVLLIAGKFEAAKALQWVAQYFGAIPKPTRKLPVLWTVEPTQDGERSVTVRRKGDVQLVVVGYKGPSALHPDKRALDFATRVLSATPTGRLHKELVETGMASEVFGFDWTTRDPGFIAFGAVVPKGQPIGPVRDKLIEVVEGSLARTPPTDEEMERIRRQAETAAERTLNDPQAIGVQLSEYMALGDWRLFFQFRNAMQAVQSASVAAAAHRYFERDNRTVALFIPEDAPQRVDVPAAPTVAEVLKGLQPRAVVAAGEAFDVSQSNIDARTRRIRIGDLNVALLPKATRGQTVNVAMNFDWGDAKSLFGREAAAQLANAMLTRGTNRFTRQQIADERTRLKMQGGLLAFRTDRAHLDAALRLTAHLLHDSTFPAAEFEQLKREVIVNAEEAINDPDQRSFEVLRRQFNTYPKGDPRYVYSTEEWIDAIKRTTLDDVKAFHRDFFGTARGEIAVVGDFDAAAVEKTLRDAFAGWKSKAPYERVVRDYADIKAVRLAVNTPDKENAVFRARIPLRMRDGDPDYPALLLANYMFGGSGGGGNRLWNRVREKQGLSYSIGTGVNVDAYSDAGTIGFVAIAAPQNIGRVEQSIRDEIERARRDGFTADELDNARRGLLRERELGRAQDGGLAGGWLRLLDADRTYAFDKQIEDRIRALTLDQVNAAFRKYIATDRMIIVVGGDAAKGAK